MPNANDFYIILPIIALVGWTLIVLLVDLWIPDEKKHITALLSVAGLTIALGLSLSQTGHPGLGFNDMAILDGFSNTLSMLFLISGIAGIAIAHDYLKRNQAERGEYYVLLLFSIAGMMLMAAAADLIVVFLALELLSIPLYILAGFFRPRLDSEEAALKYFLLGAFSSAFLLFGIALIFGATGRTDLPGIIAAVKGPNANQALFLGGASLMLIGFGFKVGAVPFHMWVPDVYHGSPTSISGFMAVATKAAGFAALLRVFALVFPTIAPILSPVFWVVAAASMILGNVIAISQTNIKRLLAYSSIANAGYILMAFVPYGNAIVVQESISAALFYLMAYALTSFGAWAVVIELEQAEGGGLALSDLSGLGHKYPWLALPMLVFMLSFTGIPLTMGFWGKFYLFKTAVDGGFTSLALIGLLTSIISAYYYLRVVMYMYFKPGDPQIQPGIWVRVTAIIMAIGVVGLSFFPSPLFNLASLAILGMK
ncbi:MAG: NADH-quinone oxidoreductase subunit N [Leptolinea sp.]